MRSRSRFAFFASLVVFTGCSSYAELSLPMGQPDAEVNVPDAFSGVPEASFAEISVHVQEVDAQTTCGDACNVAPVEAGPVCGDGVIDPGESCDDRNSRPGD